MYKFFKTQSGRCYIAQDRVVFFYSPEDKAWMKTDKTVENLKEDPRCAQYPTEDGLPTWARHAFRTQFKFDSRRVRR